MKQMNYKKLIIPNIPYVFFVYLFDKVGQAVRLAPGADISEKILNITQGFSEAFSNALPSVHPLDLLIYRRFQLGFIACTLLFGGIFRIAFPSVLSRHDDG
mgnify:CR=1 FL=1